MKRRTAKQVAASKANLKKARAAKGKQNVAFGGKIKSASDRH